MRCWHIGFMIFCGLALAGCAGAPVKKPAEISTPSIKKEGGVYHRVVKGETLWCISKMYGVTIERITAANNLSDAEHIKTGQVIFIPSAKSPAPPRITPTANYGREDFIWPVKGKVIGGFGSRKGASTNKGIDIQAEEGTAIVASRSGKVIFVNDKLKGYGRTVIIDHGDDFQTIYTHNSDIMVKVGDEVKQFTPIAKVGSTSRSKIAYLHFEIRKKHRPQNPFYYLSSDR